MRCVAPTRGVRSCGGGQWAKGTGSCAGCIDCRRVTLSAESNAENILQMCDRGGMKSVLRLLDEVFSPDGGEPGENTEGGEIMRSRTGGS
jgi:hypothetical protein